MCEDVTILEHSMLVWLNRVTLEVLEAASENINIDYKLEKDGEYVVVKGTQQDMWVFLHSLSNHYTSLTIV